MPSASPAPAAVSPAAPLAAIQARGANFVFGKEFVLERHGEAVWQRVLAAMPAEARAVWTGPLTLLTSHSFATFKAMTTALAAVVGARAEQSLAEMYELIADRSLSAIYKVFFRLADPAFVIRNYPKLWSRFFSAGEVEVPVAERGHAVVRFTLPEIFLDWLPPACLGYSTKAVTMAGGRELRMHEAERTQRAPGLWTVAYELRWQQ
ncbi:MAG TPA: hypothetical protein VFZ11_12515 [Gemmatimonadaceae bacterium]